MCKSCFLLAPLEIVAFTVFACLLLDVCIANASRMDGDCCQLRLHEWEKCACMCAGSLEFEDSMQFIPPERHVHTLWVSSNFIKYCHEFFFVKLEGCERLGWHIIRHLLRCRISVIQQCVNPLFLVMAAVHTERVHAGLRTTSKEHSHPFATAGNCCFAWAWYLLPSPCYLCVRSVEQYQVWHASTWHPKTWTWNVGSCHNTSALWPRRPAWAASWQIGSKI